MKRQRYLYQGHMGGFFITDSPDDDHYCEQCDDWDLGIGSFTSLSELWNLLEDLCDINGSGGYALQYIYPLIVHEFDLPNNLEYYDRQHELLGICDFDDDYIVSQIELLIGRKINGRKEEFE